MEIVDGIQKVEGVNANIYRTIDGGELTVVDTGCQGTLRRSLIAFIGKASNPQTSRGYY
jgi:hypothetical protein